MSKPPALRATPFQKGARIETPRLLLKGAGGDSRLRFAKFDATEVCIEGGSFVSKHNKDNFDNFLPRNKELKLPSRELRTDATKQENHLWYDFLRNYRPRFTRQRIVNNYILDFYCHEAALAVEVDGSQHYEKEAADYDTARTEYLNGLGIEVMRFDNREVDGNFVGVCETIKMTVEERVANAKSIATP